MENTGEVVHHRRCMASPAWAGQGDSMSIGRTGRCVSQLLLRSSIKVTAVMPAFLTPPGSVPAPSRRRRWNVMKLNCSQPPFAASIRHCPGLLSSFQSLFLSADRQFCWNLPLAVLRWVSVSVGACVRVHPCWSFVLSQSFLMPICRELPRFGVCRAVWQLQFIQT